MQLHKEGNYSCVASGKYGVDVKEFSVIFNGETSSISFPEPLCLLVSTKTRSSGIINFQRPRFLDFRFHSACVAWFT